MKLADEVKIRDLLAGGPGSGCHGENCGRPSGSGSGDIGESEKYANKSTADLRSDLFQLQQDRYAEMKPYLGKYTLFVGPHERALIEKWDSRIKPLESAIRMREAQESERQQRERSITLDRAELERALTIRPARPTVEDVDTFAKNDKGSAPEGFKIAKYSNGYRLLTQKGGLSIVQAFDTRGWRWTNEYDGPPKKAAERFGNYSSTPLNQIDLDIESDYIRGEWSARHPDIARERA